MEWTKSKIHSTRLTMDLLEYHVFDTFLYWYEENHAPLRSGTPEWEAFWEARKKNPKNYFKFDSKKREWVIQHGDEEFRFHENWLCEELDNEPDDLRVLWHSGYWDGIIDGMASYNGKMVWFACSSWDDVEPYLGLRVYKLIDLDEDDMEYEVERHDDFREYVGWHCDHGHNWRPYADNETNDIFYDKYRNDSPRHYLDKYGDDCILGEFTEVQFKDFSRRLTLPEDKGSVESE